MLLKSRLNLSLKPMAAYGLLVFVCLLYSSNSNSQIIEPFDLRYQNAQKGGIQFLSNVAISCTSGNCANTQAQMPPSGTGANENFNMSYMDYDGVPSTFLSLIHI